MTNVFVLLAISAAGNSDLPSAVGKDDTGNDAEVDALLQKDEASWMDRLRSKAASEGKSLADTLRDVFMRGVGSTTAEDMAQAFKSKVPWNQRLWASRRSRAHRRAASSTVECFRSKKFRMRPTVCF